MTSEQLAKELKRLKYGKKRSKSERFVTGLRLATPAAPPPPPMPHLPPFPPPPY
jgi:hypothetical protein